MFKVPATKWLGQGWDDLSTPSLVAAFELPDYPDAKMSGEGNWVDLYLDELHEHPLGRLCTNAETSTWFEELPNTSDINYLVREALNLRLLYLISVDPLEAFDKIAERYYQGTTQTGDLANAQISQAALEAAWQM